MTNVIIVIIVKINIIIKNINEKDYTKEIYLNRQEWIPVNRFIIFIKVSTYPKNYYYFKYWGLILFIIIEIVIYHWQLTNI